MSITCETHNKNPGGDELICLCMYLYNVIKRFPSLGNGKTPNSVTDPTGHLLCTSCHSGHPEE